MDYPCLDRSEQQIASRQVCMPLTITRHVLMPELAQYRVHRPAIVLYIFFESWNTVQR